MKRFIEFDVLRGVLLLMMSVDHSPSSLRRFTDQPLGFFTTAECFVFVSAFLAGMLFRKRAEKLGFAAARSSSIHRAGRIYRAHLASRHPRSRTDAVINRSHSTRDRMGNPH